MAGNDLNRDGDRNYDQKETNRGRGNDRLTTAALNSENRDNDKTGEYFDKGDRVLCPRKEKPSRDEESGEQRQQQQQQQRQQQRQQQQQPQSDMWAVRISFPKNQWTWSKI